jgi:hypothetical protein
MSQEELVEAYVHGQLSRRRFIRRLLASGVSIGAAIAYANIAPGPAAGDPNAHSSSLDHYGGEQGQGGQGQDPGDQGEGQGEGQGERSGENGEIPEARPGEGVLGEARFTG